MKKFNFAILFISANLAFAQAVPSNISALHSEYLDSLPESVRKDIESEIIKNE